MLVGVSHRLMRSTKVYVDREGEMLELKRWNVGGVVILRSCGLYQRAIVRSFRRVVWCWMLQASWSMFFSWGLGAHWFFNFCRPFYSHVWVKLAQKTLMGKVADSVKKKKRKGSLNCKYKVTFQPNRCVEPTCAVTWFIHFGFGYHLDNIRFLKCTFAVFYLFVYLLFCLLVSLNVLINQKGFLYITQLPPDLFLIYIVWFGFVSLFNGISTSVGYLMPKPFS